MQAQDFWKKIKEQLADRGKTQEWLCEQTGMELQGLRNRIYKNRFPTIEEALKILGVFDLTAEDVKGYDVVIDAFGAWAPEVLPLHGKSLAHLCDILSGTDTRLLVVGGAGSLYVNPEHTMQVMDTPDFPEMFKRFWKNSSTVKAIPHNPCASDAPSSASSDCLNSTQAC